MQVAEVFLTAGHAFQKLGDLTMKVAVLSSSLIGSRVDFAVEMIS